MENILRFSAIVQTTMAVNVVSLLLFLSDFAGRMKKYRHAITSSLQFIVSNLAKAQLYINVHEGIQCRKRTCAWKP